MFMLIRLALLLWKPLALILLLAMAFPVAAQTERELSVVRDFGTDGCLS